MFRNPKHSIIHANYCLTTTTYNPLVAYEIDPELGPQDRSPESGALRENYPLLLRSVEIYSIDPVTVPESNALQVVTTLRTGHWIGRGKYQV